MAGNTEQERIELLAAKQRLDHIYCGDPPPEDDYWATLLYRGSPVEKYGYDDPVVSSVSQPFNQPALGLPAYYANILKTMKEVLLQQIPAIPPPPSFTYEGPIGGAGSLGLLAPTPNSQKYRDFVARQQLKENYNPEKSGIVPIYNNAKSTAIETAKQTEGPNLWEKFSGAVIEGYTKEAPDENVFTKSIDQLKDGITGMVKPATYPLLAVAGVALLLVLLIK